MERRQPSGKPRRERAEAPTARPAPRAAQTAAAHRGAGEGFADPGASPTWSWANRGCGEAAAAAAAPEEGVVITGDCSSPETSGAGAGPGGAREPPGHLGRPARGGGPPPRRGPPGQKPGHAGRAGAGSAGPDGRSAGTGLEGHRLRFPAFSRQGQRARLDCPPWEEGIRRLKDPGTG